MTSPTSATGVLARPGDAIGILGGGQLGRMLAMAAADLGLDVHIFTPEADSPASRVAARTIEAPFEDAGALRRFAAGVKLATLEFENVPTSAVEAIQAAGTPMRPGVRALAVSQDRLVEKRFLQEIGASPAPFEPIDAASDIQSALDRMGGAGVLKTRRSGYDGKGQLRLQGGVDADAAWAAINGQPAILEAWIEHEAEISVVLARAADGEVRCWDPPRNEHADGVLRRSMFPSGFPRDLLADAEAMASRLAKALDYVGVLALELFVTRDGRLLANEFAPRVHNSGHWTPEACYCGQFEQHIRAVCGWPLGDPSRHSDGEMINLLGLESEGWADALDRGDHLRLYGKRHAAPGRKMGHVVRTRPRA